MESTKPVKHDFHLLTQIDDSLWYAVKRDSYRGTKFLAQQLCSSNDSSQALAFHALMYNLNQAPVIAQIFNHENIISIAGHICTTSGGKTTDFIVWDFCDAGNLSALLQESRLPESLCWHVLTSLVCAVTYLHDGARRVFDPATETTDWMALERDWVPILHRGVEPGNVFFQHPRGAETYGPCKLGNFAHAAVTNHVIPPGAGVALAAREGWEPLQSLREKLDLGHRRAYTLADELWSIGAVVFTMMTGAKLVLSCPLAVINVDASLARAEYSWHLSKAVGALLDCEPGRGIPRALPFAKLVLEYYGEWKEGTDEGRAYRDMDDDMMARWEAGKAEKARTVHTI